MRLFVLLGCLFPCFAFGQTVCSSQSRLRLDSTLAALSKLDASSLTMNELVLKIGKGFINTPYVEKTLEVEGDEPLVVNLMGLDCTTYLESIISLARLTKRGQFSFEEYSRELEYLRYREGKREHYPSRLHYFSDWIYENQQKGILTDITQAIGGKPYENNLGFMSSNPQYYPQLKNAEYVNQIKQSEAAVRSRDYYYLPKNMVQSHEKDIKAGDIIAITIAMKNLDISHVGIAVEQGGRIHLLHASSSAKKVVISPKPLSDYLMSHKSQSGIMVCRLTDLN